jgi:molybdopterin converting factor subunit 1
MNINICLFASLRELRGQEQIAMTVSDGTTLADLTEQLDKAWSGARGILETSMWAVNEAYCPRATLLHDGDVVAIIPPVAGG